MDQAWINQENYTNLEIALFLIGMFLWGYAYIIVVINNYRHKTLGIPVAAVCLNYGWEVASVLFFREHIDMGKLFVLAYFLGGALDTIIVIQMFKYGHSQIRSPYLKKNLNFLLSIGLLGSITAHSFFYIEGYEMNMAVISAYIINLAMSVAFCGLVFLPNFQGLSKTVAWTKGLGTGIISVCFFIKYPEKNFLTTLYVLTLFFDAYYTYLLYTYPRTVPKIL